MLGQVKKAVNTLANRARAAITQALVEQVIDSGAIQLLKISALDSEVMEDIERLQNYGVTSVPPADSEAIVCNVCGSRDHVVAVVVDSSANRPTGMSGGEVQVYSEHGSSVKLDENGKVLINGGGRAGARINDEIQITALTDESFFAFVNAAAALVGMGPFETITGKITTASSTVELPND